MANGRLFSVRTKTLPTIKAKILLQDPLVATETGHGVGIKEIKLPGEAYLDAGPTTARVAVVDYNADLDTVFEAAIPATNRAGFVVGGAHPTKNFKFHQVNVWAIISHTLNHLERSRVFGRRIPWAFPGGRLLVLPHGGYGANAFYDRGTGALHFLYFEGNEGPVFTCLSHDIVTHELGHAVLDGLKPYYNEVDTVQTAAFHEFFGDAVAMISAATMEPVLKYVVANRPDSLSGPNLISEIAQEFGNALDGSNALRSAENNAKVSQLADSHQEHDCSQILTGAFYDLLQALYEKKLDDAIGFGKKGGAANVYAIISAARQTSRMMLAALDYCPPAGLTYLDYARAVLRADAVGYPVDENGYRKIVEDIFVRRQIAKTRAELYEHSTPSNNEFRDYDIDELSATRTDAYGFLDANREALGIPRNVNFQVTNLYRTRKESAGGYYPPREVVLEFVWSEDVLLKGKEFEDLDGYLFPLYCGGTLVFDSDGNVLHYVLRGDSKERREALKEYVAYLVAEGAFGDTEGEEGLGARGSGHSIAINTVGNRVQATRNAALRHSGRGE